MIATYISLYVFFYVFTPMLTIQVKGFVISSVQELRIKYK